MKDVSMFDEPLAVPAKAMEPVKALAVKAKELADSVASLEEALDAQKKALSLIEEKQLPEMMNAVGITEFKLDDGTKIGLAEAYTGSLPKDGEKKKAALALLKKYGVDGIVKSKVALEFGVTEHNLALNTFERLKAEGLPVMFDETVHPQTLAAMARERARNGEEIDTEALGLYVRRYAKLTIPKPKKSPA